MTAAQRTREALEWLEAAMEGADYPGRHHLAPPASSEYLAEVLAPTGLTAPEELLTVWKWHNGMRPSEQVAPHPNDGGGARALPGRHFLYSVEKAVDWWRWTRENFPWEQLDTIRPDWLPLASADPGTLWVDCSGPPTDPAPVYLERDASEWTEVAARRVKSLARMVELWTIVLERGIWRLWRPGDIVTLPDGRTYPLQIGRPLWMLDDQHPDLPADWPG